MIVYKIIENGKDINQSVLTFLIKHVYRKNLMTFPEILNFVFQCVGSENERFHKKEIKDKYLKCRLEEYKRLKSLLEEDKNLDGRK
ncbi:MAG: hypothetical protein ACTSUT_12635 [Promethearchaeota archaeon]